MISSFTEESISELIGDYDRDMIDAGGLYVALWEIIGQVSGEPISQLTGNQRRTRRQLEHFNLGFREVYNEKYDRLRNAV